jgi:hypothetical protein
VQWDFGCGDRSVLIDDVGMLESSGHHYVASVIGGQFLEATCGEPTQPLD